MRCCWPVVRTARAPRAGGASGPPVELPEGRPATPALGAARPDGSAIALGNAGVEAASGENAWTLGEGCSIRRDGPDETAALPSSTAPGNGRAHLRLAGGCRLAQTTPHRLVAGDAISLVFDVALAEGDAATLSAALVAVDDDGSRERIAERGFSLTAPNGGWQSHQLLTGFDGLDDWAGRRLAVEFAIDDGADPAATLGLDAVELSRHRDDVRPGLVFADAWTTGCDERWVGEHYFANRLRDWAVRDERLVTSDPVAARPLRTVHRVSSRIGLAPADFTLSVRTGVADGGGAGGWSGFLIGAGFRLDHRGAALVHNRSGRNGGLIAGIDASGRAFVADNGIDPRRLAEGAPSAGSSAAGATLQLDARHAGDGLYTVGVYVRNAGRCRAELHVGDGAVGARARQPRPGRRTRPRRHRPLVRRFQGCGRQARRGARPRLRPRAVRQPHPVARHPDPERPVPADLREPLRDAGAAGAHRRRLGRRRDRVDRSGRPHRALLGARMDRVAGHALPRADRHLRRRGARLRGRGPGRPGRCARVRARRVQLPPRCRALRHRRLDSSRTTASPSPGPGNGSSCRTRSCSRTPLVTSRTWWRSSGIRSTSSTRTG